MLAIYMSVYPLSLCDNMVNFDMFPYFYFLSFIYNFVLNKSFFNFIKFQMEILSNINIPTLPYDVTNLILGIEDLRSIGVSLPDSDSTHAGLVFIVFHHVGNKNIISFLMTTIYLCFVYFH